MNQSAFIEHQIYACVAAKFNRRGKVSRRKEEKGWGRQRNAKGGKRPCTKTTLSCGGGKGLTINTTQCVSYLCLNLENGLVFNDVILVYPAAPAHSARCVYLAAKQQQTRGICSSPSQRSVILQRPRISRSPLWQTIDIVPEGTNST